MKSVNDTFFSGVWTALCTPFLNNKIDWTSFERLLEEQCAAHVRGVVVFGTTGESPTLSKSEKLELVRFAKNYLKGRASLMVGSGSNCTSESIDLSKECVNEGAEALLVVTPPYNKPTESGLIKHYSAIAEACPSTPICLYHVPGRTAQKLKASTIIKIVKSTRIEAIKEASADLDLFSELVLNLPECEILSGDDFTYLPSLSIGGRGCISVLTNIFPSAFVEMTACFSKGENKKALKIHQTLYPMIQVLFAETNPIPAKECLGIRGVFESVEFRSPLARAEDATVSEIKKIYTKSVLSLGEFI